MWPVMNARVYSDPANPDYFIVRLQVFGFAWRLAIPKKIVRTQGQIWEAYQAAEGSTEYTGTGQGPNQKQELHPAPFIREKA